MKWNVNADMVIKIMWNSLSLSSRPSSSEGWRQQLTIPVSSSSIALCPLTSPLAECTCTPSSFLCRWSTVFLVSLDNVFLPYFLLGQSVLAVRHFPCNMTKVLYLQLDHEFSFHIKFFKDRLVCPVLPPWNSKHFSQTPHFQGLNSIWGLK